MKKRLFPIDALVVWCPTWSKNLGRSLGKVSCILNWRFFILPLIQFLSTTYQTESIYYSAPAYGRENYGLILLTLLGRLDIRHWFLWVGSPWNPTIENVWTFVDLERSSISWTMDTRYSLFSKIFQIINQFWQMGRINFGVFWGYLQLTYKLTFCHFVSLVHGFSLINHYFYKKTKLLLSVSSHFGNFVFCCLWNIT